MQCECIFLFLRRMRLTNREINNVYVYMRILFVCAVGYVLYKLWFNPPCGPCTEMVIVQSEDTALEVSPSLADSWHFVDTNNARLINELAVYNMLKSNTIADMMLPTTPL